uniref:Reverse transcriptase domain-containing protein n=1 Tax=Gopherus evgoodei TaxID=1825980 RepID=A0A8C4YHF2_9SAUR
MGRDLLCKLEATLTCTPEGVGLLMTVLGDSAPTQGNWETPLSLSPDLTDLPSTLWGISDTDVGLLLSAEPVRIQVKPSLTPPSVPQYPLSLEAREGIRPIIEGFIAQKLVRPQRTPCNTPILPVKKPPKKDGDPVRWRFVQDLRVVNQYVVPLHAVVPDPATIISQIPWDAEWFTVIDLKSAFFQHSCAPRLSVSLWFHLGGTKLCLATTSSRLQRQPHDFQPVPPPRLGRFHQSAGIHIGPIRR